MSKIIFLKGLPGSGKSTWAKEYIKENPKTKRVNKDDLRSMLDASVWSKENEKFILSMRDLIIEEALCSGHDVIVDDTNFHPDHEKKIRTIAGLWDADFEVKFFDTDLDTCIMRDLNREKKVGEKVIMEMYNKYLKPIPKTAPYDIDLPDAIICDIDGTLAQCHNRSVYDTEKCLSDLPILPVVDVLNEYEHSTFIILVSGRDAAYRYLTQEWLKLYNIPHDHLLMRPEGDRRRDDIVKKELYEQNIKGKYNVKFVIDDRKRVKRMWVEEGLFVFDCNQYDIEF